MSLQMGFLGLSMALAVPAISWIKQSALFLILVVVFVIGLAMAFWSLRTDTRRSERTKSSRPASPGDPVPDHKDASDEDTSDIEAARRRLGLSDD
jgi:hypothetical protein